MREFGVLDLAKKYIGLARDSVEKVVAMIPRYQGKWFECINQYQFINYLIYVSILFLNVKIFWNYLKIGIITEFLLNFIIK